MKILFQGDSITDAGRDRSDSHNLGNGYPKFAAQYIKQAYPDVDFEFVDLGISGDQTKDLVARLQEDFINVNPDIVSVLIGVNDTWHYAENRDWVANDVFEERYRTVLTAIKEKTNAKIMMLEPFLIPVEDKMFFWEDLFPKILIIRKLAHEFACVYLPTDGLLAAAYLGHNPTEYAADGVHPTAFGADFIGKKYAEAIAPIIESLK
ncbi:MAG: GDSL-type esterase/lipase family protein [Oscillospiraceae bacterium]|nr:GDSL-type esterase/lipase family protein [Oscillospiraceae bacterium]